MNIVEDQNQANSQKPEDNNDSKDQQVPSDHPGLQKIAKNENPMANENITDESAPPEKSGDTKEQVGSEVTDGEDG